MNLCFTPSPFIETGRLQLRPLNTADAGMLLALRSDPVVNRYVDRAIPKSVEDIYGFISSIEQCIANNKRMYWAISQQGDPRLIGTICLFNLNADKNSAELGKELYPSFWGKGIMNEAVEQVICFLL